MRYPLRFRSIEPAELACSAHIFDLDLSQFLDGVFARALIGFERFDAIDSNPRDQSDAIVHCTARAKAVAHFQLRVTVVGMETKVRRRADRTIVSSVIATTVPLLTERPPATDARHVPITKSDVTVECDLRLLQPIPSRQEILALLARELAAQLALFAQPMFFAFACVGDRTHG
jgi:hypothetical protein